MLQSGDVGTQDAVSYAGRCLGGGDALADPGQRGVELTATTTSDAKACLRAGSSWAVDFAAAKSAPNKACQSIPSSQTADCVWPEGYHPVDWLI